MKGLINAISWMTILPTFKLNRAEHDFDLKAAMPWLPVIGLLIGSLLILVTWLGAWADPWLGALFGLLVWFGITGFLHADGLADLADAMGAGHKNKTRFLEVLKDPHIGTFGVMVLVLLVVSKLVLLMLIAKHELWLALLLIPVWSRWAAMGWMSLPSLSEGSASHMSDNLPSQRFLWICGLILWIVSLIWVDGLWLAPLFLWLWYVFLQNRLGGMNGDCLGAGIELTEVLMLTSCLMLF